MNLRVQQLTLRLRGRKLLAQHAVNEMVDLIHQRFKVTREDADLVFSRQQAVVDTDLTFACPSHLNLLGQIIEPVKNAVRRMHAHRAENEQGQA